MRAELEYREAERRWIVDPPEEMNTPCYFNTGWCSFADGDVTGLEIADHQIRLVRWPTDRNELQPECLEKEPLRDVFAALS